MTSNSKTIQLPEGWIVSDNVYGKDMAQMYQGQWVIPQFGCDSLEMAIIEAHQSGIEQGKAKEKRELLSYLKDYILVAAEDIPGLKKISKASLVKDLLEEISRLEALSTST